MTITFFESLLRSLRAHELSFFYTQISELSFEHWPIWTTLIFVFRYATDTTAHGLGL